MTAEIRLGPATTVVHLQFNAGEDSTDELSVTDRDGAPVPIASAVATIAAHDGTVLHQWTAASGGLTLHPDPTTGVVSRVRLVTTAAQTAAWWAGWCDAGWQLDVVDTFGQAKRPAQGTVRVHRSRQVPS